MHDPFYNKPWAPGYALPAYERAEDPLTRGDARTTPWLPRGTISKVKGLAKRKVGYSLPPYLMKEPIGSQAHTTPWIPRGTVSSMKGIKTGLPWVSNAHTLDSNGLGSLGAGPQQSSGDPIVAYGVEAAEVIMSALSELPPGERSAGRKKILDGIDPKLNAVVNREIALGKGMRQSLANAFQSGIVQEFIRLGKTKKMKKKGHIATAVSASRDQYNNYANNRQALSGISSLASTVWDKMKTVHCKVATNKLTPIAAGTAGAYYGGPVGGAAAYQGANMMSNACESGSDGGGYAGGAAPSAAPSWALPAIIGGGALALLLVLKE